MRKETKGMEDSRIVEMYWDRDEEAIRQAFGVSQVKDHHVFLKGVMSRKKQVVPAMTLLWG